ASPTKRAGVKRAGFSCATSSGSKSGRRSSQPSPSFDACNCELVALATVAHKRTQGEIMKRLMVLGVGLAGLAATPAQADEQYFGYTYSSDVLGKGASEMELWAPDRRDKGEGHYDAQDYKIELEHGDSNRFSVSA